MPNACRLSQRWHQQFCHSPSFVGHRQCLSNFTPFREYRQAVRTRLPRTVTSRSEDEDARTRLFRPDQPDDAIVVREYEPDAQDRSKLNRIDPNEHLHHEMEETRTGLARLEQELAEMRQGPFGPQSSLMQSLPKDEREQLLAALAEEGILHNEQEDLLNMADIERIAEEEQASNQVVPRKLGVTLRIPRKDQAYIRHFNQALRTAEEGGGGNIQQNLTLWKWYLRCQQQVHNFSSIVSQEVWQFLWQSQQELKVRPRHLVMLARDMQNAQLKLEPWQWLSYIEAAHAMGETATAMKYWEEQKASLRAVPHLQKTFWEIGVKMYAASGFSLKAQELAFNALNTGKANSSILVPVIAAWAKSQSSADLAKAWTCYIKLRSVSGVAIRPEVLEQISNAFLDNNHGDMALSVFKDMVLMNDTSSQDSKEVYKHVTKTFDEALEDSTTEEQINRVGLTALLMLPKQFQNKFFFTSWIKRLIGEKRIDSASMVVELMYERGIAPDAKPLNGIIGAWLREGSVNAQRKAEDLAWSMIGARADFVAQRDITSANKGQHFRKVVLDDRHQSVQRKVPLATIETFSILLQHYTRRQDSDQAEELTKVMTDQCKIAPNSYILNHWLYGDLRAGRLRLVWDKYTSLKQGIAPDLETFAALWDTAKAQFSKFDTPHAKSFPAAREIFADMKDWALTLTPRKMNVAKDDFSAELYEQIIRCFCLSKDLAGTLLASHQLARSFAVYPTDNAVRLICGQAARLLPQEEYILSRTSRRKQVMARDKSALSEIAHIVDTIESKQRIALVDNGIDPQALEDPGTDAAKNLRLRVLTEFICMFMEKSQGTTGSYRNDLKIAAQTMRVKLDELDLDMSI